MRNLKKVLAAIMVILMISSTMVVSVFADTVKSAGDICASLGVLKGGSNGVDTTYLAMPTQRIQAAIIHLRMLGLEDEAKAYKGTDNFTDASLVSNISGATNILAYLKANPKLGWVGDGKKFSPSEEVSAQQFYKVLLTILGYSQGTDFNYNETILFAKFNGMGAISSVTKLKNGDMATALVEALGIKMKGSSDTLIAKLVKDGRITESSATANGFKIDTVNVRISSVTAPANKTVDAGTTNLNLPSTVKALMSDGKTNDVTVTWDTSAYNANLASDYIIPGKINGYDPGVSVKVTVKALVFDVNNVSAVNLRQVVINYNNAVSNSDEATKLTNYTINGVNPIDAALSSDKKSVTLTVSSSNFFSNYASNNKLVINKALGFSTDKTIENISVSDTLIPEVVSVEAAGPLNLTVNFSEPLDDRVSNFFTSSSFVIDDNRVGIDALSTTYSRTSAAVNIKLTAPLTAGAHTLKVKSPSEGGFIKDSAGYNVKSNTVSFNFAPDTSALTATVTESKEKYVKVKFNKPLKQYSFAGNSSVLISHTYQGLNQITGAAAATADNQEFTLTFLNPLPPGTPYVFIDYAEGTTDSKKIQDNYGNIFVPAKFQVTIVADTTKPTVTAELMNPKQIKVTFSKAVNSIFNDPGSAINYVNYVLKDASGTIIPWMGGTPGIISANTVFTLNTNSDIGGGALSLTIKNVRDISVAQNKMDDVTLTIIAKDMLAPTLDASAPLVKVSDTMVRINFSEPMDPSSISDRGIYMIGLNSNSLSPLSDKDTITLANNNRSAIITFNTAIPGTYHLFIGKVKDAAGNYASWGLSRDAGEIGAAPADLTPSAVEVISGDKIRITVNDQIASVGTYNDYEYRIGSGPWSKIGGISSVTYDPASNKTYIEVTLTSDIGSNTGLVTPVYLTTTDGYSVGNASPNIKNAIGQKLKISALSPCIDKYPPKFISVGRGVIADGKLQTVVLTFSENLYVASVQDSDFAVEGFEVANVSCSNYLVTIELKAKEGSSGEKPKVTLIGSVEDYARNAITGPVSQTCP